MLFTVILLEQIRFSPPPQLGLVSEPRRYVKWKVVMKVERQNKVCVLRTELREIGPSSEILESIITSCDLPVMSRLLPHKHEVWKSALLEDGNILLKGNPALIRNYTSVSGVLPKSLTFVIEPRVLCITYCAYLNFIAFVAKPLVSFGERFKFATFSCQ
jgi:hypothetical protein